MDLQLPPVGLRELPKRFLVPRARTREIGFDLSLVRHGHRL